MEQAPPTGRSGDSSPAVEGGRTWTFLSNHGHVLVALHRDPHARVRDIAAVVGITERATLGVMKDLEEAGYVTRTRVGRRNAYELHPERHLRHPAESDTSIRDLLGIFAG